jgi:hypothetical protein
MISHKGMEKEPYGTYVYKDYNAYLVSLLFTKMWQKCR